MFYLSVYDNQIDISETDTMYLLGYESICIVWNGVFDDVDFYANGLEVYRYDYRGKNGL